MTIDTPDWRQSAQIEGSIDTLGSGSTSPATISAVVNHSVQGAYVGIAPNIRPSTGSWLVWMSNDTKALTFPGVLISSGITFVGGNNAPATAWLPIVASSGDTVTLHISQQAGGAYSASVRVASLLPPSVLQRPDGRMYPVGMNALGNQFGANSNLIAAVAGMRILLASLVVDSGLNGAACNAQVSATINGATVILAWASALAAGQPTTKPDMIPPGGLLLDYSTPLAYTLNPAAGWNTFPTVFAAWDIVT